MVRINGCALGITSVLAVSGCATLNRPTVREVTPHITRIDWEGVNMVLDVQVENPYSVRLHVPRFNYAIDIEDREFFASQTEVATDLPARRVGTIALPVRFAYSQLWQTYEALADVPEVDYRFRADFLVTALDQKQELSVSHAGTVPVLRLPKISFDSVDFTDVSMTGARMTIEATLHNPNVFPLGFGEVGYHLSFGDAPVGGLTATTGDVIGAGDSGKIVMAGQLTGYEVLARLLAGRSVDRPRLVFTGRLETPWGSVPVKNP